MRTNKYRVAVLFISLLILSIVGYSIDLYSHINHIWVYGNSLKIAQGLLPYRDFNLLTTPFYYYLGALFLKVNENIHIYHFYNALVFVSTYLMCYKIALKITQQPNFSLLLTQLILIYTAFNITFYSYNSFCILIILGLLYIELLLHEDKLKNQLRNNLLIGLFLAVLALTKQSVGAVFIIGCFFAILLNDSDLKEKIKIGVYRLAGLIPLIILFFAHIVLTDSLDGFINYTILGLSDFSNEFTVFDKLGLISAIIPLCIFILAFIKLIKTNTPGLKTFFIYVVCSFIISYPIFDLIHVLNVAIPVLLLSAFFRKKQKKDKKGSLLTLVFSIVYCAAWVWLPFSVRERVNLTMYNDSKYLRFSIMDSLDTESLTEVIDYIKKKETEGHEVIIVDTGAMVYDLALERIKSPYNYLIASNLGLNGEQRIIKEFMVLPPTTLFFVSNNIDLPEPAAIKLFIINNFVQIESVGPFNVYQVEK